MLLSLAEIKAYQQQCINTGNTETLKAFEEQEKQILDKLPPGKLKQLQKTLNYK